MKIIFARHGETDYNKEDKLQGVSDTALNEKGIKQAVQLAKFCSRVGVQAVYASPLRRAQQTANAIVEETGAVLYTEDILSEICYGEWEGKKRDELKQQPAWKDREKDQYSFIHPGSFNGIRGESYEMLYKRLEFFFNKLDDGPSVVVVAHLGVMRSARVYYNKLRFSEFSSTPFPNDIIYIVDNNAGVVTTKLHRLQ